ncbi:MAG: DUF192 domain-containing protein [Haloarculaceae archaeon]
MRVVHEDSDDRQVLATNVDTADTFLSQARGLMFQRSIPDDYALVFRFDRPGKRFIHMLFVPFPTDVVWVTDDEVVERATLQPWRGIGRATADAIFEFPAGSAAAVDPGDALYVDG